MRFHWQNLNDDKTRPRWGGGFRHGRAWLTVWHSPEPRNREEEKAIPYRPGWTINPEWAFFWRDTGAISVCFERGDGVGIKLHFALPWLFSFWLTIHGGPAARLAKWVLPAFAKDQRRSYPGQELPIRDHSDREISIRFHDWAIWWSFWTDPMGGWDGRRGWRRRLRDGSFHPIDFLLGHTKVTDREIERAEVQIPMPERSYKATVIIEDRVWRRPRWPLPVHRHLGANVRMEEDPIPFPGKGENSWDCGEDATYASSFPIPKERFSDPVSYAIGHVVAGSLDSRRRHGGLNWVPKEDHRPSAMKNAAKPGTSEKPVDSGPDRA